MSQNKNPQFTIFTPCYNGGKMIHRVFESVSNQTFLNYEWIIINDGSTDNSDEIIKCLLEKYVSIKDKVSYITQTNQGKHRSWNTAVKLAKGELFIPADCDDTFVPDTLRFFYDTWNKCSDMNTSGINVCCYNPESNQLVGSPYPEDGMFSDNIELHYKYRVVGEHWGCIKTDILKQRPFPDVKGRFFSENYIWYKIALSYKVICCNKLLRAYYYEPSSLSNNILQKFNITEASNRIRYQIWEIKNVGKRIFDISVIAYFSLFCYLFKSIIIYLVSFMLYLYKGVTK